MIALGIAAGIAWQAGINLSEIRAFLRGDAAPVLYRVGSGDILYWQSEIVQAPPNPDEVLASYLLAWDTAGFRLPQNPATQYAVIALGDSYTEGNTVPRPWPDVLAAHSGLPTRNLGFRGYHPQHYAYTLKTFPGEATPQVVVVGFFGGNDVAAATPGNARPFYSPNQERDAPRPVPEALNGETGTASDVLYPMTLRTGQPMVLLNEYLSWLNLSQATLRSSINYALIDAAFADIARTVSDETCVVLAYFPSKPEVYLPYVQPEDQARLAQGRNQVITGAGATLELAPDEAITYGKLVRNRRNTAQTILALGAAHGFVPLDVLPALDAAVQNGEEVYYTYDTHWNQRGHDLAGAAIATHIQTHCQGVAQS